MKRCGRCGYDLALSSFARDASKHDGYSSTCSACKVDYRRQLRRSGGCKPRAEFSSVQATTMVLAAKDRPCADCGVQYPPVCMDLDHVRGTKLFGLSRPGPRSRREIEVEIAKCEVRCANCHRLRHYA